MLTGSKLSALTQIEFNRESSGYCLVSARNIRMPIRCVQKKSFV
jgi:hypothetical protein